MIDDLKSAFMRLKQLSFPVFAEHDELADFQSELAEFDGHVAGIVTTTLGGYRGDTSTLAQQVANLRAKLESVEISILDETDQLSFISSQKYLDAIEEVVKRIKT